MFELASAQRNILKKATDDMLLPFFAYDMDGVDAHAMELYKLATQKEVVLYYATKANPLSSIVRSAHQTGMGIDVASMGELAQAINCQVNPAKIIVTGPAKSKDYFLTCLQNSVDTFVIESINQLKWLNQIAKQLKKRPKVLLRVQLDWENDFSSLLGGNDITPFGISPTDWPAVNLKDFNSVNILGFHLFQWGNILDESRLLNIWRRIFDESVSLSKKLNIDLQVIDLGGGLGIPYENSQSPISFVKLMEGLEDIKGNYQVQFWMELGRYLVGPYGNYLTKIIDRKSVRGKEILILEGGINHLVRKALTSSSFPCVSLRDDLDQNQQSFELHGPLCTALDHLGSAQLPQNIDVGDWIVFRQCGAYGFTESMPLFLAHPMAGEIIYSKDQYKIMREPMHAQIWLR